MKKNLLLTTALVGVAFALPAMAQTASADSIYTNDLGTTVATGTTFTDLHTTQGQNAGAVTVDTQGDINIGNDVHFIKNTSVASGGAMKALSGFEIGDGVHFTGNISNGGGGALYIRQSPNTGTDEPTPVASTVAKIGNNAEFKDNIAGKDGTSWFGGAIAVEYAPEGLTIGEEAYFEGNKAEQGGAVAVWVSDNDIENKKASVLTMGNGAKFSMNEAETNGGAFFINDGAQAELGSVEFSQNKAGNYGGAIYVGNIIRTELGEGSNNFLKLGQSTFEGNEANYGGAIFVDADDGQADTSVVEIASGSLFKNNHALAGTGGAIYNRGTIGTLDNVTFDGNTSTAGGGAINNSGGVMNIVNSTFVNNHSDALGGAIYNKASNKYTNGSMKISNSIFENNTSGGNGGAIANGGTTSMPLEINNVTFKNNHADQAGGAISASGTVKVVNSTFEGNSAAQDGGAYKVAEGTTTFEGVNTFTNNKIAASQEAAAESKNYSDINLQQASSIMNVSGTLNLDGGISGLGKAHFNDDATLNVTSNATFADEVTYSTGKNVSVGLIVGKGEKDATFNLETLFNDEGADFTVADNNALYTFTKDESSNTWTAAQKSANEVASSLGATGSQAAAIQAALSDASSDNQSFNDFTNALNSGLQSADKAQVAAAKDASELLTAEANPLVRTIETEIHNMVFSTVSDELNNKDGAIAESKSSGNTFKQVKAWIRGLFNRVDHDSTSKASGFDGDIYGVAMGIDKQVNNAVKLGIGYAYNQADISSGIRDIDVDTHTAMIYGQYRPANWYINTLVSYNWSDYDEKKLALGYNADADYDTNSLGIQSVYGYEMKLNGYDVTPEAGLRYVHISRDGYTDALGTSVASDDSDILTAVVSAKVAKDYIIGNNMVIRLELKAGITYDLIDDDNNPYVSLANNEAYRIDGEDLNRLGFEFGAKVATNVSDNLEISAGWEGRFREDYQDHTAMLNAKYSF